jgi:hypothetical protein
MHWLQKLKAPRHLLPSLTATPTDYLLVDCAVLQHHWCTVQKQRTYNFSCVPSLLLQLHDKVISMADPDETKPIMRLAALLLHAADLANGADLWSVSKLWARWCHQGLQCF